MTGWPDDELLLARLRDWLAQTRGEAERGGSSHAERSGDENGTFAATSPVGLYRLAEEFTALRHEVKLQTKSSRQVQEQADVAAEGLKQAIEALRSVEADEAGAAHAAAKPLVEALIGLDEALDRGRAAAEQGGERWTAEMTLRWAAWVRTEIEQLSWWQRPIGRALEPRLRRLADRAAAANGEVFDSLVEGYRLVQLRLRRTMQEEDIERMACIGEMVDPHSMTVIEAVDSDDQQSGMVLDELRPGYLWQGKVVRLAEVRVARQHVTTH